MDSVPVSNDNVGRKADMVIVKNHSNKAIYSIFHILMSFVAIYLSFRCNDNHFNAASFVVALCCPYLYIIYTLATKGTCSK